MKMARTLIKNSKAKDVEKKPPQRKKVVGDKPATAGAKKPVSAKEVDKKPVPARNMGASASNLKKPASAAR